MRELWAAGAITQSPHVRRSRFETLVHLDIAARVQFDAGQFGSNVLRVRRPARSNEEIRDFLMEIMPQPQARIDHFLRILRKPANKTYEFTYVEGARLIRPWLEVQGQTAGFARLLSEQLSPAQLRAELSIEGPPGLAYVLRMDSKRLFA